MKRILLLTIIGFSLGWFAGSIMASEEDYYEYEPMPGPQGPPGQNGTNGTNGANGINGTDGAMGYQGPPGTNASINRNDYQRGTALGLAMAAHILILKILK